MKKIITILLLASVSLAKDITIKNLLNEDVKFKCILDTSCTHSRLYTELE